MNHNQGSKLRIGIIGAGFAGTAFAATLHKLSPRPVDITLFDKTGCFGVGDAYRTPFPFHLLNVRARDMSAFEDDPRHFVNWLTAHHSSSEQINNVIPLADQFVSRPLYANYLRDLLAELQGEPRSRLKLHLESMEVVDVVLAGDKAQLILQDGRDVWVDKVILALGNNPPMPLPFPVSDDVHCITNPWDYVAPKHIPSDDPVLIVGTGLSMIDTVLTLQSQQHQGKIYAVSRRGLLPLPHAEIKQPYQLTQADLPHNLLLLTKYLRTKSHLHNKEGGDWRAIVNELRAHLPALWEKSSLLDKKRFIRHLLPYWNIHRHRVQPGILDLLHDLAAKQQFQLLGGRVLKVEKGLASIRLRHQQAVSTFPVKWIVNCLGPAMTVIDTPQTLVRALLKRHLASLDVLNLGLTVSSSGALKDAHGQVSSVLYTLGSMRRGASWESIAVPEIRKQCFTLATQLSNDE
jgi:uncharacterized NAD(P)/FAD-binding protein YdhS